MARISRTTGIMLAAFGAALASFDARAEVRVVATTPDLASIAKAVGGDLVNVTALAAPNQDPHYVDPRPSFMLPMSRADLLIVQGLGLEIGWLPPLLTNARNPKIQAGSSGHLDASAYVERLEIPTAKIDRSMGDIHPGGNPHFTYDPRAARRVAQAITARLANLDPNNAARYRAQGEAYQQTLKALAEEERARFSKLPEARRRVVAYHPSFPYLWDWLGIEQLTTIEPKPGVSPDPGHVAAVLKQMRSTGTRVIAQEEYYPSKTSRTLARLAGASLVLVPGGTRLDDGETYVERIRRTAGALYAALSE